MPEGDTIWRTAAMLRAALAGRRVTHVKPDGLGRLAGSTVEAVEPVGKHLVIRFDNGYALHTHMRMRGVWHVYRLGEPWRRPAWQRVLLVPAVLFGVYLVVRALVELAGRIPSTLKLKGWRTKHILMRALRGVVPDAILRRRKQGFGVPLGLWMRGPLRGVLEARLDSGEVARVGLFVPRTTDEGDPVHVAIIRRSSGDYVAIKARPSSH